MAISFIIGTKAVSKERPRFKIIDARRNIVSTYSTKNQENYEAYIRSHAKIYFKKPLEGKISIKIDFFFAPPQKLTRSYPCKSDLDNLLKSMLDAFNKVIYKDDIQVIKIETTKSYGKDDLIEVTIEEIID